VQADTGEFTWARSSQKWLVYAGLRTRINAYESMDLPSHGGSHEFESHGVHSPGEGMWFKSLQYTYPEEYERLMLGKTEQKLLR
jgi:hypothetical protein